MMSRIARLLAVSLVVSLLAPLAAADEPAVTNDVAPRVFRIDTQQSWLRVLVYRGGMLGGLGHNHVVSYRGFAGEATLHADGAASAQFSIPVSALVIDDPAERTAEGEDFPGEMAAKDIAGTRGNMLGRKLLDATRFPEIGIRATCSDLQPPETECSVVVTLKGKDYPLTVPVRTVLTDAGFEVNGELTIKHRDIGLSPFKAALGALRVSDKLTLKFAFVGSSGSPPGDGIALGTNE